MRKNKKKSSSARKKKLKSNKKRGKEGSFSSGQADREKYDL